MSFNLTSSAHSPKKVTRDAIISASKNVHKTGTAKEHPEQKKVEKQKINKSLCLLCGSNAPTDNGLYFDNDCKVVYEHRVCSKCGYAFTVRRPMTDDELASNR